MEKFPALEPRLLEDLCLGQVAGAAQRSSTHRGIDVVATLQDAGASVVELGNGWSGWVQRSGGMILEDDLSLRVQTCN